MHRPVLLWLAALVLSACGSEAPGQAQSQAPEQPQGSTQAKLQEASGDPVAGQGPTPTREEVLLMQRIRNASDEEVSQWVVELRSTKLQPGDPIPDYIRDAGNLKEAMRRVDERYPEFIGKTKGDARVQAARENPIRFRQMMLDRVAMVAIYEHELPKRH